MKEFCVKRYELYFKPSIAKKLAKDTTDSEPTLKVTARLAESVAFDYGNGTTALVEIENLPNTFDPKRVFDTRYETGIKTDFDKWVRRYLWDYYGSNLEKVEDISSTINLKYFRIPKDNPKEKKEITYGEALHILLGTWKDNKYPRAMLTIPNWIECRFSTIQVADYTDPQHPMVMMAGYVNVLPDGMEYEEE